jgi:cytoskeletal protein CcmA (bactofilin family)
MAKKILWWALLVVLLWPGAIVLADEPGVQFDDGRIFVDEDVALEPGETFAGDLGVLNGDLIVPEGSAVNGDVFVTNGSASIAGQVNGATAVIGGDLTLADTGQVNGDLFGMSGDAKVAGRVNGNLSVMFGDLSLLSSAVIRGDLIVMSGDYDRADGAQVLGEEMANMSFPVVPLPSIPERPVLPSIPPLPALPDVPELPKWTPPPAPAPAWPHPERLQQSIGRVVGRILTAGFLGLILISLGALIALIWPRPTRNVSECIAALPVQSFGLGLLTFLIAAGLELLATVVMILIVLVAALLLATIILIPLGLLLLILSVLVLVPVPLALFGGMVLGWVALADLVGRKFLGLLRVHNTSPLGSVIVGLLLTGSMAGLLWVVQPVCCGWPFIILLTSVGLGSVFHTRFGRQTCQPQSSSAPSDVLPADAMEEEAGLADVPWTKAP